MNRTDITPQAHQDACRERRAQAEALYTMSKADLAASMTPVRACQVASELLRANAAGSCSTMEGLLGDPADPRSYAAAIEVLRRIAASAITGGRPSAARSPRP